MMDSSSLILKSLITVFFIFFAATVPASVLCNNNDEYEEQFNQCRRKFVCGNFTSISYPFWGGDRPHFCGHPSFKLDCRDHGQNTVMNITGLDFRVLSIDQSPRTMIIARLDIWDNSNLCFPNGGIENTTLNYTIFNYPSLQAVQNLTLSYGCPVIQVPEEFRSSVKNFTCGSGGENSENVYYFGYDSVPINLRVCRGTFVVPIFSTGLEKLQDNENGNNEVREVLNEGFEVVYNSNSGACEACERSGGSCGVNSTDDAFLCYCRHKSSDPLYCPQHRSGINWIGGSGLHWRMKTAIGALVTSVTTVVLIIFFIFCLRRKNLAARFWTKMAKTDKHLEGFIRSYGHLAVQRYRFCEVKKMTLSFQEKLGEGGYGDVYKGKLVDGRLVAVKVLKTTKGNGEEFINEVASISKTSHINIVTLLGYCLEGSKRALIYEFMSNGSLEKFIYNDKPLKTTPNLGWEKLLQIATGIARGLEYLHRGCSTRILHFDIKPHNILLDEDFCPKISDFGLSKLCTSKESILSMMDARGTIGYIAPEVFNRNFGGVSHKSDVYSYGMMILEMVGGSKNIKVGDSRTSTAYFPHWIYKQMELDKNLELHDLVTTEEDEIGRKMVLVGFWCIQTKPSDRPSMSKVIQMLQGSIEVLQIPPKPFLSSQTSSPEVSFSSTSSL